jgi:hypothetical protein
MPRVGFVEKNYIARPDGQNAENHAILANRQKRQTRPLCLVNSSTTDLFSSGNWPNQSWEEAKLAEMAESAPKGRLWK